MEDTKPSFVQKHWLLIVVLIYVLVPLDFLPDRLPVIGTLDDSLLLLIEVIRQYADYKKGKKI
ncbi:DUF1232 domain-containing protein [Candidatus Dojkabacteria bacterium]|nr:DUF1232 domain-containing protein [Candidatus Dojkabacteria bacterium]